MRKTRSGFTIVELLIVIVVIAILAAITIVAYNGIQERSRMSRRASDVAAIRKALELYKADKGVYPPTLADSTGANLPTGFAGAYSCTTCYAYSVVKNDTWLKGLVDANIVSSVPVDVINDNNNFYMYYSHPNPPASTPTCTGSPMYVLVVHAPGAGSMQGSKGALCPGWANFSTTADRAVFSNIP